MLQVWGIVAVWKGAGVEKCAKLEKKRGELSGVSLRACVWVYYGGGSRADKSGVEIMGGGNHKG